MRSKLARTAVDTSPLEILMTDQPDTTTHEPREVLVGIDESAPARTALAAAIEEAVRRSAPLHVVTVFESAGRFGARYSVPIPV